MFKWLTVHFANMPPNMPPTNADRLPASIWIAACRCSLLIGHYIPKRCNESCTNEEVDVWFIPWKQQVAIDLSCTVALRWGGNVCRLQENVVNRQGAATKQLKTIFSCIDKAFYLGKHINVKTLLSVNLIDKRVSSVHQRIETNVHEKEDKPVPTILERNFSPGQL